MKMMLGHIINKYHALQRKKKGLKEKDGDQFARSVAFLFVCMHVGLLMSMYVCVWFLSF